MNNIFHIVNTGASVMNKPVAWIDAKTGKPKMEGWVITDYDIPLYTHPANACKHGVDDGACKECYLEATHSVKELSGVEIIGMSGKYDFTYEVDIIDFVRACLRKAQEK